MEYSLKDPIPEKYARFYKRHRVVAISENTNSFGLKQFIAVADDGTGFKACANSLNLPEHNQLLHVRYYLDKKDEPTKELGFTLYGWEIPEILQNVNLEHGKKLFQYGSIDHRKKDERKSKNESPGKQGNLFG